MYFFLKIMRILTDACVFGLLVFTDSR